MHRIECPYLSFSSAGTNGFFFCGFLDALEDHLPRYEEWRGRLKGVAGTSAGAIAALLLVLGVPRASRRHLIAELGDVSNLLQRPDLTLLYRKFGIEDGRQLRQSLRDLLSKGGLSPTSTLGDLARLLRIDFVCVATDLRTGRAHRMSGTRTPEMPVVDAVYASCCVPFLFAPLPPENGAPLLVDGTLSEALPRIFPPEETLYVTLDNPLAVDRIDGWPAFITALVRCNNVLQTGEWPENTIVFAPFDSVGFDLHLREDGVRSLICAGYASTVSWLLSHRPARAAGVLACAVATLSPPLAWCARDAAPECAADPSDTEASPGRGTFPPP